MPKPNTRDAMKRYRAGKAGFTDKAHLKAKGLIPRADGTKKKSPQYEDAPANATGTAVAGTGDDSSTVVVRRKKDKEKMKDRLLRRFKIKETIDRLVPAIEPPTDEVRERVDQLKTLALGEAFTSQQIKQAYGILNDPRYKQGNYSGAVSAIEKLAKGLSKHPDVANALRRANEGFASAAQRRAAFASGYKAKGKKKKKEETELEEARYYIDGRTSYKGVSGFDGFEMVIDAPNESAAEDKAIEELQKARSRGKVGPRGGGAIEYPEVDTIERTNKSLMAPQTYDENEYNPSKDIEEDMDRQPQDKDVKKVKGTQPKKYYKTLPKDMKKKRAAFFSKQKYKKSDDDDDYKPAPGDAGAKTKKSIHTKKFKQMYGEVRDLNEKIKGLENKAKKTGMPYGILKKVYDRGMAAWKGGHRPGTTQQQWAFARVNSFVTKSSGTWGGADKDLAKKVRAAKK
tara:strand:+ start:1 stop:1368 length:1368 start_codon:yes stop_codon:yes gene_type:complete